MNAHNFLKAANENAKEVVCKAEQSEASFTEESPFGAYHFNGVDEGKDDMNGRRIKTETDEETQAEVEEEEDEARLKKKTANFNSDVVYELDEYDDEDPSVIPIPVSRTPRMAERNGWHSSNVLTVRKLPSFRRATLVTSCFNEVYLPSNQQLSVRIVDAAARFDLHFAERGVVPFVNVCLRVGLLLLLYHSVLG